MREHVVIIRGKLLKSRKELYNIIEQSNSGLYITYLNPFNYFFYKNNIDILPKISYIYLDGLFTTFLLSIFFRKRIERLSFDLNFLAGELLKYCVDNKKTIFFVGGTQEEIEIFISKIRSSFPDLIIKGYCHGYLPDEVIIKKWEGVGKSDFLIVGLGNVRQETFISKIAERGEKVFVMSCGAFITQTAEAKSIQYYPEFFYRYNLRWLYRLFKEKKIIHRVLIYYPRFLISFIYDYFSK